MDTMEENVQIETGMKLLLCRFVDESILTPALVKSVHDFLFEDDVLITFFKDDDLYDAVVYLKDLMQVNRLKDVDEIIWYFSKKRKSIARFIERAIDICDAEDSLISLDPKLETEPLPIVRSVCLNYLTERRHDGLNYSPNLPESDPICLVPKTSDGGLLYEARSTQNQGKRESNLSFSKITLMAENGKAGDGHRNGAVKERTQVFNPKTETWVKRDSKTGEFLDGKKDGKPFKGITKEN